MCLSKMSLDQEWAANAITLLELKKKKVNAQLFSLYRQKKRVTSELKLFVTDLIVSQLQSRKPN